MNFSIKKKVVLELKGLTHLEDVYLAQAINYPEVYGLTINLLVNFEAKSIELKKLMKRPKK